MQKAKIVLPWNSTSPCPCGSNDTLRRCCGKAIDRLPRAKPFNLELASNLTERNRDGCYLAGNGNCGERLTLEHPVSHNIIKQWPNMAQRGFKGTDGTVDVLISTKSAGMRVLCDRHNSSLSPLDEHAGRVFRELGDAVFPARQPQENASTKWVYIDGPKLEAFATKMIATYQASNNFTSMGKTVRYQADWGKIRRGITQGQFEHKAGLYITASYAPNEVDGVQHVPLTTGDWLVGVHIVMRAFSFIVIFDGERCTPSLIPDAATYRGSVHQLYGQGGSAFIFIAWPHRPQLRNYSRGRLEWSAVGSSSMAPMELLRGPPAVDVRTKLTFEPGYGEKTFAPKPPSDVKPSPPLTNRRPRRV